MKKLIFALLLSPLAASASSTQSTTEIQIKPWWPVYCAVQNYPLVNQVSDIDKLAESDSSVTFGFKTTVGACQQQLFVPTTIAPSATTSIMRNKIVLFQKPAVTAETRVISANTAYIKLTFNKKVTFKHVDNVTFQMSFYPNGYTQPRYIQNAWGQGYWYQPASNIFFPWNVDVAKVSANETQMRVRLN